MELVTLGSINISTFVDCRASKDILHELVLRVQVPLLKFTVRCA